MKTSIFQTLEMLQLTSTETRSVFNRRTRDVDGLIVWKDDVSGVIYIDDFYTGNETYIDGSYREEKHSSTGTLDYESFIDAQRRFDRNLQYVAGKRVVDFGCGAGDFLRLAQSHCANVCGIELQKNYADALNSDGISCVSDIDDIEDNSIDVCLSFHVIEHLPNPLDILSSLKRKLVKGGTLVVEVPHANDFLLANAANEDFKQFTLWSQHLVLHTRDSLQRMLSNVGFNEVLIEGVQRYPLSNHLNWLINGKAGGHKSALSSIDTLSLREAYSNSLSKINATDTLVAIAKVL